MVGALNRSDTVPQASVDGRRAPNNHTSPNADHQRAIAGIPTNVNTRRGRIVQGSHIQTLGQMIRQARQQQGLSLRQAALQISRGDGTTISPQYLHDLERDRRRPSLDILHALARGLALNALEVLAHFGTAEAIIRAYLRERPDCELAIIQLFLTAQQHGFAAWERFTRQIASVPRPAPR